MTVYITGGEETGNTLIKGLDEIRTLQSQRFINVNQIFLMCLIQRWKLIVH